jgi:hypothetical protein
MTMPDAQCAAITGANGFRLELAGTRYEFPEEQRGSDADWVEGWVAVEPAGADRPVRLEITWRTEEVEGFARELRALVDGRVSRAELSHLEEQVELVIRGGREATVEGLVTDHHDVELRFETAVAPDALERACAEFERLAVAFPVRSSVSAHVLTQSGRVVELLRSLRRRWASRPGSDTALRVEKHFEAAIERVVREAAAEVVAEGVARLDTGLSLGGRFIEVVPSDSRAASVTVYPDYPTIAIGPEGHTTELFGSREERLDELALWIGAVIDGRLQWRYREPEVSLFPPRIRPFGILEIVVDTADGPRVARRYGDGSPGDRDHGGYEPYRPQETGRSAKVR